MADFFKKVDLSNFEERKEEVSKELAAAAKSIGFFYVTGHGISQERIDRAFEIGKKWFKLSNEEKEAYKLDLKEYVGWKGEGVKQGLKTERAQLEQMIFGHTAADNDYSKQLVQQAKEKIPEIEEFTQDFLDDLLRISTTILRGLAIALGEDEDLFVKGLDRGLPDIAGGGGWNHYLPFRSTSKETEFRIPAHADAELFTLLFQQKGKSHLVQRCQPGLEVTPGEKFFQVANNGKPFLKNYEDVKYPDADALTFYPMPPVEGAITVNIGDFLMRFSDGEYLSTYHRVRAPAPDNDIPEGERYTLVYFAQPARSTLVQGPKKRWPPILAGDDTAQMAATHYKRIREKYWLTGRLDGPPTDSLSALKVEESQRPAVTVAN